MRRLRLMALLAIFFSVPMQGQTQQGELFGGYSLERIASGCGTDYRCTINSAGATTNLNGWITSVTGYFYKSLGVTAQFTGNYGYAGVSAGGGFSSVHRYAYQFGPAYAFRLHRANAFAHALLGGISQGVGSASVNGIAPSYRSLLWSVGGGVDINLSNHLSIRAAQIDYERHHLPVEAIVGNSTSSTSGLRYSAGVVLRF